MLPMTLMLPITAAARRFALAGVDVIGSDDDETHDAAMLALDRLPATLNG